MTTIKYPTPAEALAYAENTGRTAMLARKMPDDFDWSIFVSKAMRHIVADLVDVDRLERYNSNFYSAIFPAHQYVTTRRLLKEHGIKFTACHRAKIMLAAALMVKEASK